MTEGTYELYAGTISPTRLGEWRPDMSRAELLELLALSVPGSAARVRRYLLTVISGEAGWVAPELVKKMRLFSSVLPMLARLLRLEGVRTLPDLLPETDAEATVLLLALNAWTAEMLAGPAPATGSAPDGTSGADEP